MPKQKATETLKKVTRYVSQSPDTHYTFIPTSEFDVERAVNGKPYWAEQVIGEQTKLKKWIITDCSIRYEIEKNPLDKRKFLNFIMKQGVECFVWTGVLTKVHDINELMKAMMEVEIIHPAALQIILSQQGITKNESEIIDYPREKELRADLYSLIPGMSKQNKQINFADFEHLKQLNLTIWKTFSNSSIETICFNNWFYALHTKLLKPLRQVKTIIYTSFDLNIDQAHWLRLALTHFDDIPNNINVILTIHNNQILEETIKQIKDLPNIRKHEMQNEQMVLKSIGYSTKNITGINVINCSPLLLKQLLILLPLLTHLEISYCDDMSDQHINTAIGYLTHLKSLKISDCRQITSNFLTDRSPKSYVRNHKTATYVQNGNQLKCYNAMTIESTLCNGKIALVLALCTNTIESFSMLEEPQMIPMQHKKLLGQLIELDLHNTPYPAKEIFQTLITTTPNLRRIKLANNMLIKISSPNIQSPNENTTLKIILTSESGKINHATITILNHLIGNYQNIQLCLDEMDNDKVSELLFNTNFNTNPIKLIEINQLKCPPDSYEQIERIQNIFEISPEINKIDLSNSKRLVLDKILERCALNQKIQTIILNGVDNKQLDNLVLTFTDINKIQQLWPHADIVFKKDTYYHKSIFDTLNEQFNADVDQIIQEENTYTISKLKLKELYFFQLIMGENLLDWLVLCPNITYLGVDGLSILPHRPIFKLTHLTTLEIFDYFFKTPDYNLAIRSLILYTPNLMHFKISDGHPLDADTFFLILTHCPKLISLSGGYLQGITSAEYTILKEKYPNIEFELELTPSTNSLANRIQKSNNPFINELRNALFHKNPIYKAPQHLSQLNTDSCHTTLHARQFFIEKQHLPPVNNFRLRVRTKLLLGSTVQYAPTQDNIKIIKYFKGIRPIRALYDRQFHSTTNIFYGQMQLPANQDDWYPLPSLSPDDTILDMTSNTELTLGYCVEQALYYIKPIQPLDEPLHVTFILKAKWTVFNKPSGFNTQVLSQLRFDDNGKLAQTFKNKRIINQLSRLSIEDKIAALAHFCQRFKPHSLNDGLENGIDKLNAIIKSSTGACAARCFVFMALSKELGINARAVESDCHVVVEVSYLPNYFFGNNIWHSCELGGAPCELEIHPINENPVPKNNTITPPEVSSRVHLTPKTITSLSPNNAFNTWDSIQSQATNYDDYINQIMQAVCQLSPGKRNLLISLDIEQIEAFHSHLIRFIHQNGNKFYYLNTLGDVCEYQANISDGRIQKSGSYLMEFINEATSGDALISNWTDFKSSYVGYNTMMDEDRNLKNHAIHNQLSIIVLIDKNKLANMGEDFFSRFRIISACPALTPPLPQPLKIASLSHCNNDNPFKTAEFFDNNWDNLLLGHITINGSKFIHEDGVLVQAIKENRPGLILKNPPIELEKFRLFLAELKQTKQFIINGERWKLPDDFMIHMEKHAYSFVSPYIKAANNEDNLDQLLLLNSQTFNYFLKNMRCEQGLIYHQPGWIKYHANKDIYLLVTETLAPNYWAHLIHIANQHQCTLHVMLAPNITLPKGMNLTCSRLKSTSTQIKMLTTNELELAEEKLIIEHPKALVVSINTQLHFHDLIAKPVKVANNDSLSLSYQSVTGSIWEKLKQGDTLILKGSLSPTLARQLESLFLPTPYLWVNGEIQRPKGTLILLTDTANPLSFVTAEDKIYTEEDYWTQLNNDFKKNWSYLKLKNNLQQLQELAPSTRFSYGQLRVMANKMLENSLSNPFKPFFRMDPKHPMLSLSKQIWFKEQTNSVQDSMAERHNKIRAELAISPYLFIVGNSGVGKSTYILNQLNSTKGAIYLGIKQIKQWIQANNKQDQILFIDEANLAKEGTWDILEGLFNKTPGILIDGQFYPATPNKKLICAGNFSHFAGRVEHRFFQRHGQVIHFKEMPDEFLASTLIIPALDALFPNMSKSLRSDLTAHLLNVYYHINTIRCDHPFTSRNLKSICLRMRVLLDTYPELFKADYKLALNMAIVDEANVLILDRDKFECFLGLTQRDAIMESIYKTNPNRLGSMIITTSRKYPLYLLKQQFAMRDLIIHDSNLVHFEIANLLLEGLPGIGKSRLIINYLKSIGYTQNKADEKAITPRQTTYYYLTPTDPGALESLLQKAFHEGAYVIIEELNTLPLEEILNKLYDGIDKNGVKAAHKGFGFCGTQNPITLSNREALSIAFTNRLNKLGLEDYPKQELRDITDTLCPNKTGATQLVDWYMEAVQYASENHKKPAPTPRDLFEKLALLEPKIAPSRNTFYHNTLQTLSTENKNKEKTPLKGYQ